MFSDTNNSMSFVVLFTPDEVDHGGTYSEELKVVRFQNGRNDPYWDSTVTLNCIPDDSIIADDSIIVIL